MMLVLVVVSGRGLHGQLHVAVMAACSSAYRSERVGTGAALALLWLQLSAARWHGCRIVVEQPSEQSVCREVAASCVCSI
jgi:hypothetical protein